MDPLAARRARRQQLERGSSMGWRAMLMTALIAFVAGGALVVWLGQQRGWFVGSSREVARTSAAVVPQARDPLSPAAKRAVPQDRGDLLALRIDELEARLARVNLEAEAAAGNATRAEGLLVAFAARRSIERGAALGYLEGQLRLRFGEAKPNAVDQIISFGAKPVTIDQLSAQLSTMELALKEPDVERNVVDAARDEVSSLFVFRRADAPSPLPDRRYERAQAFLANGRVQSAINEVSQMPGRANAAQWLREARRYVAVGQALDILETTAVLEPGGIGGVDQKALPAQ